jgi:hypothetical protein
VGGVDPNPQPAIIEDQPPVPFDSAQDGGNFSELRGKGGLQPDLFEVLRSLARPRGFAKEQA